MKTLFILVAHCLMASFLLEGRAQEVRPKEKFKFKGQKESLTDWGNIQVDSFLSLEKWKEARYFRDQQPDWEREASERNHREIVGRVYQCVQTCRVDRGEGFFGAHHRSSVYEGDEVHTLDDSYAWIFLFDGTMVRLSPKSSITFNEINIGAKKNFLSARVNAGNVLWLSRMENLFKEVNVRETDVIFFPYAEYESLPTTQQIDYREDDLLALVEERQTYLKHYQKLNGLVKENNALTRKKETYAFLVMPNATLMGSSPNVEMVVLTGGKSFFKKRSMEELGLMMDEGPSERELYLQLRGFENKELVVVPEAEWRTVDEKGRNSFATDDINWLTMGEFITKRIPSLMVAREIFLQQYSEFAFRKKYDPLRLAREDGYRLWGSDIELRLDFLKDYFRKVETANLLTSSRFKNRLIERGEKVETLEYGRHFFITALNRYYQFEEKSDDKGSEEVLNSTTKMLWKKMHGIK